MRIGELASRTGLAPSAIRYYERRDMFSPGQVTRHRNGYRDYTDEAERRIRQILAGREAGFTLEEMRTQMTSWDTMSNGRRAELLTQQLAVIEARIEELVRSRDTLRAAQQQLRRSNNSGRGSDPG